MKWSDRTLGVFDMKKVQTDTPALLLDLDAAERNITHMSNYFRGKKAYLRPHVKVHKSPFLAHKQIRAGARGITCAKVSEAEVMAHSGIEDILIANEVIGEEKLRRLARLAKACQIQVPVDDLENAKQLSRFASLEDVKVGVLVDINLGLNQEGILNRCGVPPEVPAVKLAREIAQLRNLEFKGLMAYEGGLRKFPEFSDRKSAVEKALDRVIRTKDMIEEAGLDVETVSCGGTMSYNIDAEVPGVTEVQAGSYVFMDATYQKFGLDFELSLTVAATVISKPQPEKVIIDAGLKAISADSGLPIIRARPELECIALNAEHGHLKILRPDVSLRREDKLELVPTHVDTTVCLHDNYTLTRQDEVVGALPIACRGKLQ